MIRSQRVLLALFATALTFWLPFGLAYDWKHQFITTESPVIGFEHAGGGFSPPFRRYSGVYPEPGLHSTAAALVGMVVPACTAVWLCYLLLGWKHSDRLHSHHCLKCGYQLNGKCSECGTSYPPGAHPKPG